jgi:hypothetical protein
VEQVVGWMQPSWRRRWLPLNRRLAEQSENKSLKQAVKTIQKDYLPRLEKYEEQEHKLAGRSSYAKTDEDGTCMRMKEDRGAEKPWGCPTIVIGQPLQPGGLRLSLHLTHILVRVRR